MSPDMWALGNDLMWGDMEVLDEAGIEPQADNVPTTSMPMPTETDVRLRWKL